METIRWTSTTRWLHLGLAFSVTIQLLLSLVLEEPGEAEGLGRWALIGHELFGLLVLSLALLHWGWILAGHDGGWRRLLPWDGEGRRAVWTDLKGLLGMRLPEGGPRAGLPSLVEGLGLLVVTAQGSVGLAIFVVLPPAGSIPERFEFLYQIHGIIGNLVWLYWFGHVGMALVHRLAGDETLRMISPFRQDGVSEPSARALEPKGKGDRGEL
ncbi:MAG: cytochrome b/b6 domain-containing protein [Methylohalobius sp. ZOD2]|nr:cytochrome b/b6 domain-containing protein [Methylothermaceae bacterium]